MCRGSGAPKAQAASAEDSKARERFGSAKSISSAQFNKQVRVFLNLKAGFIQIRKRHRRCLEQDFCLPLHQGCYLPGPDAFHPAQPASQVTIQVSGGLMHA